MGLLHSFKAATRSMFLISLSSHVFQSCDEACNASIGLRGLIARMGPLA